MRRLLALLCAGALVLGLTACGAAPVAEDDGKVHVTATLFPYYDFARAIGGDRVAVTLLLAPGRESHSYEPTPLDVIRMAQADVFLYNGGEGETWVEETMEGLDTGGQVQRRMMDYVDLLEEELAEGMEAEGGHDHDHDGDAHDGHDHDEDDGHGVEIEYDEHIWTSPKNAAKIVDGIRFSAKELLPEKAERFDAGADEYIAKINDLDRRFSELLSGEERYFVFGDRFPLLYFFREYSLNYYAAFPGCGSEVEPSAGTVAFLTEKLKSEQTVGTVFYIELSNHKLADVLAEETGLPTAEFHTCHNIAAADFEAGETYVSLMERNYNTLKSALGRE